MHTKHWLQCPKCHYFSGDDWKQCEGKCPIKLSPYYDEELETQALAEQEFFESFDTL